jgi:GDP-4-dehydro-6-deoxy-D-mannose reductase
MERVLVTGADGFVASHLLVELAEATGCRICGIGLKPEPLTTVPGLVYLVTDLTDYDRLRDLVDDFRPDAVFHLAAQPSVAVSWDDPWTTYRVNMIGQLNLMEALRTLGVEASVHIACSSEEYGLVHPDQIPLDESMPLQPCSHYAVSKVGQEVLALMYHEAFDWRVIVTRGFNQAGPGQSPDFVVSSFARQIALIEAGKTAPVLKVGNLEALRDFTDVRDTVRAYRMLMEEGTSGAAYNVCSGSARPVREILETLLSMSESAIEVEPDPARQRPSDIPIMVGDNTLINEEVGWEPAIPLEQTLRDTLDYWRERERG